MEQSQRPLEVDSRINDPNLAHMGALIVEAARQDLTPKVHEHVSVTGLENPNSVGKGLFFSACGVVRSSPNPGKQEKLKRWEDRVFWNEGNDGSYMQLGGRFVIEAPLGAVQNGWVTATDVTGVYAQDSDGHVKNIVPAVISKNAP